jgi:hypothetical protein
MRRKGLIATLLGCALANTAVASQNPSDEPGACSHPVLEAIRQAVEIHELRDIMPVRLDIADHAPVRTRRQLESEWIRQQQGQHFEVPIVGNRSGIEYSLPQEDCFHLRTRSGLDYFVLQSDYEKIVLVSPTSAANGGLGIPYRYDIYRAGTDRFELDVSQIYYQRDSPEHFRMTRSLELTFRSEDRGYRRAASE